jgi:hypothetical protein
MAVTNVAGEMPTAQIDGVCPMPAGPMYLDEPECLSCQ